MEETIKRLNSVDNEILELNGKFQHLISFILKFYEDKNNFTAESIDNEMGNEIYGYSNIITEELDSNYKGKFGDNTNYNGLLLRKTFSNVNKKPNSLQNQKLNIEELVKLINKTCEDLHISVEEIFSYEPNIHLRRKEVENHVHNMFKDRQIEKYNAAFSEFKN